MSKLLIGLLLALGCSALISAQEISNDDLLDLMRRNFARIEDYEVDMEVSVDLPVLRIPLKKIHYYYKAPDKSKIEARGFAMVPKEGITPFVQFLQEDSLDIRLEGRERYNDRDVYLVKVNNVQAADDSTKDDTIDLKLWVDVSSGIIYKGIVRNDDADFITALFNYEFVDGYVWLPVRTELEIEFPPEVRNLQMLGKDPVSAKKFRDSIKGRADRIRGTVVLKFSNYRLNRGLSDKIFEDESAKTAQ